MKFSKIIYVSSIMFLVLLINKAIATTEMEITDYPKEILIERGWLKSQSRKKKRLLNLT